MEVRQFRVVVRASDFERSGRFYGEVLALPRVQSWDRDDGCGALFQAGAGVIEVLGRPRDGAPGRDDLYDYQGPIHKLTITLIVPSAQKAYDDLIFRDKNIPGGLLVDPDGAVVFETHDPDGVKVRFKELV